MHACLSVCKNINIYRLLQLPCIAIGRLRVCVRQTMCVMRTITFDKMTYLWPKYLAWWFMLIHYRSSSKVKVVEAKVHGYMWAKFTGGHISGYARRDARYIKTCQTMIYRLKKYRDTGIPWYFVTSSIVENFCKNPTVRIICCALNDSLCHIY